jgi:hypothetical protein
MESISKGRFYALLFAVQTGTIGIIISGFLPIYLRILDLPGHQLDILPRSPPVLIAALVGFHMAYWFRLIRVPVPRQRPSLFLGHVILFVSRLTFIFGGAFFGLVAFRHLPALGTVTDPALLTMRLLVALIVLFSLFCYALEIERFGDAFRPSMGG